MRFLVPLISVVAVVACAPPVPNSGVGVGFDDYSNYEEQRAARDTALAGSVPIPSATEISSENITSGASLPTTTTAATTTVPSQNVDLNNPGISDEQDFSAVSSRESIESDRQRLEAQSQAYETIQPTALPTRSGNTGPSIVEFALSTTNQVGQSIYSRSIVMAESRFNRNCAKYASSDMAQIDFLKSGGPTRDRKGLDPDGDGFACYWDPTPFRRAVNN